MINIDEFRHHAHQFVDWMADYLQQVEKYAVKSQVKPREIFNQLPDHPPSEGESIDAIMADFQKIIMPGMTHWQSPNFFAYFPANSSYPSILAEMLTATLGAQCMVWETSPAAAELEERVMNWLKLMTGLPSYLDGVIQDTASTATLCAIITARERISDFRINDEGFKDFTDLRAYCSTETHSSIEKDIKIAGLGRKNLIKVPVDTLYRMDTKGLEEAIKKDIEAGKKPFCVVATIGTTGSTAVDPVREIGLVCRKYNLWLHIDAALAGTALVLPEFRWMTDGIEFADSFVFNPHKWMFTNFDCSAYFVKDNELLIRTFEILPEYLKTKSKGQVNDYRDWGIALGRRFRALKLWFVIRNLGVEGIQEKIRHHIGLAKSVEDKIALENDFEVMVPVLLNTICFRYKPKHFSDDNDLNTINEKLLTMLNQSGKVYLSHTKLNGRYTIRMVTSQTSVNQRHVDEAWELIKRTARSIH
jgi:aromatic-L-amino-acid decarboxylase